MSIEYRVVLLKKFFGKNFHCVLDPLYRLRLSFNAYDEVVFLLKDNPAPSELDIQIADDARRRNYRQRCRLSHRLMERIDELGLYCTYFHDFAPHDLAPDDCKIAFKSTQQEIDVILSRLATLHAHISSRYRKQLNAVSIEELDTMHRINVFTSVCLSKALGTTFFR